MRDEVVWNHLQKVVSSQGCKRQWSHEGQAGSLGVMPPALRAHRSSAAHALAWGTCMREAQPLQGSWHSAWPMCKLSWILYVGELQTVLLACVNGIEIAASTCRNRLSWKHPLCVYARARAWLVGGLREGGSSYAPHPPSTPKEGDRSLQNRTGLPYMRVQYPLYMHTVNEQ